MLECIKIAETSNLSMFLPDNKLFIKNDLYR